MDRITTHREGPIIINAASGRVSFDTIAAYVKKNIDSWINKPIIWDLTKMNFDPVSAEDIRKFAIAVGPLSQRRKHDKTALVAPLNVVYGMAKALETYPEFEATKFRSQVFRNLAAAKKWLLAD
jgi:hypothetical protein